MAFRRGKAGGKQVRQNNLSDDEDFVSSSSSSEPEFASSSNNGMSTVSVSSGEDKRAEDIGEDIKISVTRNNKKSPKRLDETTRHLKFLLKERGTLRMTEAAFNHSLVKEQVDQIVKELKRLDEPLFSELKTLYTGSSKEGLKVDKPCEFDVMLVLTQVQHVFEAKHLDKKCLAGYAKLVRRTGANFSEERHHVFKRFLDEKEPKYLSSEKMMQHYRINIKDALKNITQRDALASLKVVDDFKINSPAVTVSIVKDRRPPIHVDLVLSIQIQSWPGTGSASLWGLSATVKSWPKKKDVTECREMYHVVAKQCPVPVEDVSPEILWRISFSLAELKLMGPRKIGCQKQCLKVAKIINGCEKRYNLDAIKSFHLKMSVMNLMKEHPKEDYWSTSNLGPRVIDLLLKVKNNVEKRQLLHFFIPRLNLFEGLDEGQASSVSKSLGSIIQELKEDPKEFCENLLHSNVTMY